MIIRQILVSALVALLLASCGSGSGSAEGKDLKPNVTPAKVVYLSTVRVPEGAELAFYAVDAATGTITYSGKTAPPVGTVVILNGSAYKVASQSASSSGVTTLSTTTPNVEDVFEELDLTTSVSLTQSTAPGTARPQSINLNFSSLSISPNFGDFPVSMSGTLGAGTATIDVKYSRANGWTRAKILAEGTLSVSADLSVNASIKEKTRVFPANSIVNVPIPATLGTLAFKMPITVFVKADSSLEVNLGHWERTWAYKAGAEWLPNVGWTNLSNVTEVASTPTPSSKTILEKLLSGLNQLLSGLTLQANTTIASLTVGPRIEPKLSALNDTVGVIGLRYDLGLKAQLNLKGTFPSLVDCAEIPFSLTQSIYAFINYKTYESLLDFEGDISTADAKILTVENPVMTQKYGTCNQDAVLVWSGPVTIKNCSMPNNVASGECTRALGPGNIYNPATLTVAPGVPGNNARLDFNFNVPMCVGGVATADATGVQGFIMPIDMNGIFFWNDLGYDTLSSIIFSLAPGGSSSFPTNGTFSQSFQYPAGDNNNAAAALSTGTVSLTADTRSSFTPCTVPAGAQACIQGGTAWSMKSGAVGSCTF